MVLSIMAYSLSASRARSWECQEYCVGAFGGKPYEGAHTMRIKPEHLDELLTGYEKPEDLLGEDGLFKQLKKALLERALGAEMTHHLGYEQGDPAGRGTGNHRNGTSPQRSEEHTSE